ncbi:MAG: universal stress protein [Desulfovermiculus sp.]|nr:universal stress protein [Desulfovermiculus sp.]
MELEIKKILLATDFSKNAWQALRYAASLAKQNNARVTCLHVLPELPKELSYTGGPDLLYGFGPGHSGVPVTDRKTEDSGRREKLSREGRERAEEMARDHIRSLIVKLKAESAQSVVNPDHSLIRIGNPVECILDETESGVYDMLVMGRRGHGKLRGPRTGGVALGVVSRSTIPVLVIGTPKS